MSQTRHFDLGHGISLIDAGYHRSGMVGFYLMVENRRAAVIDTGMRRSVPVLLEVLERRGLDIADIAYVIPTHVHLDHAGGAGEMMRRFPSARLVVHPRGARHLVDPSKLKAGVDAVYGAERAAREFGTPVPVPAERVLEAKEEGLIIIFVAKTRRRRGEAGQSPMHLTCIGAAERPHKDVRAVVNQCH